MRILFVSHYASLYGANRSLLNLIEGLIYKGIEPFVICTREGDFTDALKKMNIHFYCIKFNYWCAEKPLKRKHIFKYFIDYLRFKKRIHRNLKENDLAVNKIVREVRTFNPDIVHSNSSVINIGSLVAKKIKKPHVWHLREFGKEDFNIEFVLSKKKVRNEFNRSAAIIGISNSIKAYYQPMINVQMNVIYNGVIRKEALKTFKPRSLQNKDDIVFGIIGLLHKNKRQDEAIKALQLVQESHPNTRLIIAGNGRFESKLKTLVSTSNIKNVDFIGFVEDPFDFFSKIDVSIICSRFEAMGRVTVEAMSAAKPVIGFNGAGTAEIIVNNVTGLLYRDGYEDLAHKMNTLIENNTLISEYGIQGQKIAKEKYTVEAYSDSFYKVLQLVKEQNEF